MRKIEWIAREVLQRTNRVNVPLLPPRQLIDTVTFLDEEGMCDRALRCPDGKVRTPHQFKETTWHAYVDGDGDRWALRCPKSLDNTQ